MAYLIVEGGRSWGFAGRMYRPGRHVVDDPELIAAAQGVADIRVEEAEPLATETTTTATTGGTFEVIAETDTGFVLRATDPLTPPAQAEEPVAEPEPAVEAAPPEPAQAVEFACETCGRSDFKSKASLTRHVNRTHAASSDG